MSFHRFSDESYHLFVFCGISNFRGKITDLIKVSIDEKKFFNYYSSNILCSVIPNSLKAGQQFLIFFNYFWKKQFFTVNYPRNDTEIEFSSARF